MYKFLELINTTENTDYPLQSTDAQFTRLVLLKFEIVKTLLIFVSDISVH